MVRCGNLRLKEEWVKPWVNQGWIRSCLWKSLPLSTVKGRGESRRGALGFCRAEPRLRGPAPRRRGASAGRGALSCARGVGSAGPPQIGPSGAQARLPGRGSSGACREGWAPDERPLLPTWGTSLPTWAAGGPCKLSRPWIRRVGFSDWLRAQTQESAVWDALFDWIWNEQQNTK